MGKGSSNPKIEIKAENALKIEKLLSRLRDIKKLNTRTLRPVGKYA